MRLFAIALLCGSSLATACVAAQPKKPPEPKSPDKDTVAAQLIGGALADGVAYRRLAELTDTIGPRLSGSPGAAAAVEWAQRKFQEDGIAVHLEPVMVPHWVRGVETGRRSSRPRSPLPARFR